MTGYKNGEFLTLDKLLMPADSLGAGRGYGAYDFFSVINKTPFYLDRHIQRFARTVEILKFSNPLFNEVEQIANDLIAKNDLSDFAVKILAFPTEDKNLPYSCDLFMLPVSLIAFDKDEYKNGAALLLREYKRFLPEAKSTSYMASQYYKSDIDAIGAVDVLYHDNGLIRETSRGNVFIVKNGKVITPKSEVLNGITKSVLIDIVDQNGMSYSAEDISVKALYEADEVFVSSSTKLVLPITRIEDKTINNGNVGVVSQRLFKLFTIHKNKYCNL